jgi:lipoyl(octanoyl) transferase
MRNYLVHPELHLEGDSSRFAVQFHLLGSVTLEDGQSLQRRLVYEAGGFDDGRIIVLLCEHPASISVGRRGSRGHIRLTNEQLRMRQVEVRWVGRGGGCVLHGPGQIAIYPIVPLGWHGWSVGEYLGRLQRSIVHTLEELRIRHTCFPGYAGVWGRSGQLAACGIAVHNGVTCHGAFVNVNPIMTHHRFVDAVDPQSALPGQKTTMGCLLAERRKAISIPNVRSTLIPQLAASFGTQRYHLITGHPLLAANRTPRREARYRAS